MSQSIAERLDRIPRKVVAAQLRPEAKADRKPLADADWPRLQGMAIERAIVLAALTKQDVAYRMGYGTNQAPLSRWIAGTENPQFAKLFAIQELRWWLVVSLADVSGEAEIVTTLRRVV